MGKPMARLEDACTLENFNTSSLSYVTLLGMWIRVSQISKFYLHKHELNPNDLRKILNHTLLLFDSN